MTVDEPEGDEPITRKMIRPPKLSVTPFWVKLWGGLKRVVRTLLSSVPALILMVVATILIILRVRGIQMGGLFDKLLGRNGADHPKAAHKVDAVPEDRVDAAGNLIPIDTPDSQGVTQARVVRIEQPGVFDRSDQVKALDGGVPVVVELPDGVKARDVDKVLVIKPDVYAVTIKNTSRISRTDVDTLLLKYGDKS